MLLIPYQVDVRLARWPVSNYLVIALAVAAFCGQCAYPEDSWANYVLEDMNPLDWLGHVSLQPDILHLIGNMLFSGFLVTPSVQKWEIRFTCPH